MIKLSTYRIALVLVLIHGLSLGLALGYTIFRSDPMTRYSLLSEQAITTYCNGAHVAVSEFDVRAMALELREYRKVYGPLGPTYLDTEHRGTYTPSATPPNACIYCERLDCDTDCNAYDQVEGSERKTAAQFRAEGRRQALAKSPRNESKAVLTEILAEVLPHGVIHRTTVSHHADCRSSYNCGCDPIKTSDHIFPAIIPGPDANGDIIPRVPRRKGDDIPVPPAGGFATADQATAWAKANMAPLDAMQVDLGSTPSHNAQVIVIRNNGSISEPELERRIAELQKLPIKLGPEIIRAELPTDLATHINSCPIGWHDGQVLVHRSTTSQDIATWVQKLHELAAARQSIKPVHGPGDGRCSDETCSCHRK